MARPRIRVLWFLAAIPAVKAAQHTVEVARDGLAFKPETLSAKSGDVITYTFYSGEHSVTQTSAQDPCQPVEGGFHSGSVPAEDGLSPVTWRIVVNDTEPLYIYSGQDDSCQNGMVHIINPPSGDALKDFKTSASTAEESSPGDDIPGGGQRILNIDVGAENKLNFSPSNIRDQLAGTIVQFHFYPKNNSVVQATYDDPCHPLKGGFSSGFVPIDSSSTAVGFSLILNDTDPVYFYDAQTIDSHCQKGMVGSINAPLSGDTYDSFVEKARRASQSTIPLYAPQGGELTVNNSVIPSVHGSILSLGLLRSKLLSTIPEIGHIDESFLLRAGGGPIMSYNWRQSLSNSTASFLQLLQFTDNILLETLLYGYTRLTEGEWQGVFPPTILQSLSTTSAQAYIHRTIATTPLQHFKVKVPEPCAYKLPLATVDSFLSTVLTLILLEIGVYMDFLASAASKDDVWLAPGLASALGAKSRSAGLINMMQNKPAASAVGEALLPSKLAYSFLNSHYISFCSGDDGLSFEKPLPRLQISTKETSPNGGRLTAVNLDFKVKGTAKYVAWFGPYGDLTFTEIRDGAAEVPGHLYGHVWAVVCEENGLKADAVAEKALAGPEIIWVAQP